MTFISIAWFQQGDLRSYCDTVICFSGDLSVLLKFMFVWQHFLFLLSTLSSSLHIIRYCLTQWGHQCFCGKVFGHGAFVHEGVLRIRCSEWRHRFCVLWRKGITTKTSMYSLTFALHFVLVFFVLFVFMRIYSWILFLTFILLFRHYSMQLFTSLHSTPLYWPPSDQ